MEFHIIQSEGRKLNLCSKEQREKTESERPTNDYKCLAFDNTLA